MKTITMPLALYERLRNAQYVINDDNISLYIREDKFYISYKEVSPIYKLIPNDIFINAEKEFTFVDKLLDVNKVTMEIRSIIKEIGRNTIVYPEHQELISLDIYRSNYDKLAQGNIVYAKCNSEAIYKIIGIGKDMSKIDSDGYIVQYMCTDSKLQYSMPVKKFILTYDSVEYVKKEEK